MRFSALFSFRPRTIRARSARALALFALSLLSLPFSGCAAFAGPPPTPTLGPAAQVGVDWQVYRAVIANLDLQPAGTTLLLREPSSGKDGLPLDLASHSKSLLRDIQFNFASQMQPSTLENFRDRNQSDIVSADNFPASSDQVFLEGEDLDVLEGEEGTQSAALQARFPGERGLIVFSFIGFNVSHDQALVYVRYPLPAGQENGEYLLLNKIAGSWKVGEKKRLAVGS